MREEPGVGETGHQALVLPVEKVQVRPLFAVELGTEDRAAGPGQVDVLNRGVGSIALIQSIPEAIVVTRVPSLRCCFLSCRVCRGVHSHLL